MLKRLTLAAALCAALFSAGTSRAAQFTYALNVKINPSGDLPAGSPTATIEDTAANTVRITMDLTNTPTAQFSDIWLFNWGGTQAALNALTFTYNGTLSSGPSAESIGRTLNDYGNNKTAGFGNNSSGLMDIAFSFSNNQANRFNGGEKVVYDITGTGLTAALFNVPSDPTFNANGPYYTAADFQGIPGGSSGVVGANQVTAVPEPSSIALVGLGLAGLAVHGIRRRRSRA